MTKGQRPCRATFDPTLRRVLYNITRDQDAEPDEACICMRNLRCFQENVREHHQGDVKITNSFGDRGHIP